MTAQRIKKVVIVGGGTAGWMAAASISRLIGRDLNITLVESDEIGTVGVGEATIPTFFALHQLLKINEAEFLSEVQGTIKLGISFENWKN
ncbi:MAG: tryptophan 7-halogenase, partial [SAR202 cluster bacterium]|nr:tryptophan 7-halogenase [SAR202 cluster bacterium]